jgi:hypothetical protein
MILFGLQESSGAYTSSVHRSSIICNNAYGMYYKDYKVYGMIACASIELFIYNTKEDSFDGIYNLGTHGLVYIWVPVSGK